MKYVNDYANSKFISYFNTYIIFPFRFSIHYLNSYLFYLIYKIFKIMYIITIYHKCVLSL